MFSVIRNGRDFEIGFEIDNINIESINQQTIINSKLEDSTKNYPGFAFRRYLASNNLELSSRSGKDIKDGLFHIWNYMTVQKVVLYRINNVLYISVNDGDKIKYHSYDAID